MTNSDRADRCTTERRYLRLCDELATLAPAEEDAAFTGRVPDWVRALPRESADYWLWLARRTLARCQESGLGLWQW